MLIPSIDVMGGKIVQLVQGEKTALEFTDVDHWIQRFRSYPVVQLIDLDAAMGKGDNRELIAEIVAQLVEQGFLEQKPSADGQVFYRVSARYLSTLQQRPP